MLPAAGAGTVRRAPPRLGGPRADSAPGPDRPGPDGGPGRGSCGAFPLARVHNAAGASGPAPVTRRSVSGLLLASWWAASTLRAAASEDSTIVVSKGGARPVGCPAQVMSVVQIFSDTVGHASTPSSSRHLARW